MDFLSRGSSLISCWVHGNWSFSFSPQKENLELCFLCTRTKVGHTRLDHWHTSLSLCLAVGRKSHRGGWEIWLNNPFASCFLCLRRFQSLELHLCAYLFWCELSLPQVNCASCLLAYPTAISFSPQLNKWHCNHGAMRCHLKFEEWLLWTSTTTQEKQKREESERWQKRWIHSLDAFNFPHRMRRFFLEVLLKSDTASSETPEIWKPHEKEGSVKARIQWERFGVEKAFSPVMRCNLDVFPTSCSENYTKAAHNML